ncbi:glycine betaine ABC transporter substrate-binding protein [Rhodococcus zopfii]|uniref:glycine betaine ABC transporter substrate-binding protein n=1 Tax=Rhodococcus zopfii TaxID=43772 RepID=UPI003527AC97
MTTNSKRTARGRTLIAAAASITAAVSTVLAGCASPVLDDAPRPSGVVVGAGAGTDGELLAHLYAGALRRTGIDVTVRDPGDRAGALAALDSAEVTLVPGYTGRLLRYFEPAAPQTDAEDVFTALGRALPTDLTVADYATAQDRAVLVLSDATSTALGVTDIDAMAGRCAELTVAATAAFTESGGLDALASVGCVPAAVEQVGDAEAVRAARGRGALGALTTASPALVGADVVALADAPDRSPGEGETGEGETGEDTRAPVFPAQNVVPLFRRDVFGERQLDALSMIAGELTTADLAGMLGRVDAGEDSAAVADEWLGEHV